MLSDEEVKFEIVSSKSVSNPPTIRVTFSNGVKDELDLTQYKMNDRSKGGCNYFGRLKNDPNSSVGISVCLNKPEDEMEVILLSKNNENSMFLVDFFGNVKMEPHFKQALNEGKFLNLWSILTSSHLHFQKVSIEV